MGPAISVEWVLWVVAFTEALVGLVIVVLAVLYQSRAGSIWWLLSGVVLIVAGMLAGDLIRF